MYGCQTYCNCEGANCTCEESNFYDALEARLVQMTYVAHKEVLYERIKQKIIEQEGQKIDQIVDLLLEASKNQSEVEKVQEQKSAELKEKLRDLFEE